MAKEALRAQEFTEQQLEMMDQLFDSLPNVMIDVIVEGVSRLSRDQDKIIPYQLLKLLKGHQCRIRTPDGIWNPAIGKDWQELEEEFEDAIEEYRVMAKRMFRRKKQKASRGEFVGEPVPAGFIVPY